MRALAEQVDVPVARGRGVAAVPRPCAGDGADVTRHRPAAGTATVQRHASAVLDAGDSLHGGAGAIRDDVYVISRVARAPGQRPGAHCQTARRAGGANRGARRRWARWPTSSLRRRAAPGRRLRHDRYRQQPGQCAAADLLCVLLLPMRGYTREQFAVTPGAPWAAASCTRRPSIATMLAAYLTGPQTLELRDTPCRLCRPTGCYCASMPAASAAQTCAAGAKGRRRALRPPSPAMRWWAPWWPSARRSTAMRWATASPSRPTSTAASATTASADSTTCATISR